MSPLMRDWASEHVKAVEGRAGSIAAVGGFVAVQMDLHHTRRMMMKEGGERETAWADGIGRCVRLAS